jgi:putative ABC transport system substrate-binding protein
MRRRDFLAALSGAIAVWPHVARAQQPALPVVGFISRRTPEKPAMAAFRAGLREAGIDDQNVLVENRIPWISAALIRRKVAVIVVETPTATAIKVATATTPIVFISRANPVQSGLVVSLNRPGRNVTGVTTLNNEVEPKRLELLHELLPSTTTIFFLLNPTTRTAATQTSEMEAAASTLGVELRVLNAIAERDLEMVFATLSQLPAAALVISPDASFNDRIEKLAELALHYKVPAIFSNREFAAAGGLMSYGGSITEAFRLAGDYAARILNGEKADNLPVKPVVKGEFVINLKTAKTLGLTVPITLLGRADEVIE